MVYDELVIGSGLSALGVTLGFPKDKRVLVIAGAANPSLRYYGAGTPVLCADEGFGGLGNYWHGVIPTGEWQKLSPASRADFAQLFDYFYPGLNVEQRLGEPWLFVPWRPIRPAREWSRLLQARGGRLAVAYQLAVRVTWQDQRVSVETDDQMFTGRRLWICAGALGTPALLRRSFDFPLVRSSVSDHVIAYLGQVARANNPSAAPRVLRTSKGMWVESRANPATASIAMLRPARFAFKVLDKSIEQRAAFGLATGSAIARIFSDASPALIAEALFNKFGLFRRAGLYSAYAQLAVADAYLASDDFKSLTVQASKVRAATDYVRSSVSLPGFVPSRSLDTYLPGIHLHHSVDPLALQSAGMNLPASSVQIADASVLTELGGEHHSFKMMVAAMARATVAASVS